MILCRDHGRLPSPVPSLRLPSSFRRKVGFVLSRLWHFADVTPLATRMRLVQSLVVPLLMYCDVMYSQSSAEVARMLNVAFNSCARYVYKIPRYQSISSFSRRILGVPLNAFFDLRKTMLMYRLLTTLSPSYLFDRLRPARSSRTMNLIIPLCNTTNRLNSFLNDVPPVMKRRHSLVAFRESYHNLIVT
jgi:hypothetical protein